MKQATATRLTTIVLADDHEVVRLGLRTRLEREQDFRVVGEAGDGQVVLDLVERVKPDVLVLDLVLPTLGGFDVMEALSRRSPTTRVVILSMHDDIGCVAEALRKGASGYVLKEAAPIELVKAVREAVAGRCYLSPPLSEIRLEAYLRKAKIGGFDLYESLTSREREVLHLVAEGLSNKEVASRLSISTRTAETHRAHLMNKLGLNTQGELIRFAYERGIMRVNKQPN
jgi:DNA-binding NarL/FixJ family response regulator